MARLRAIDGQTIDDLVAPAEDGRRRTGGRRSEAAAAEESRERRRTEGRDAGGSGTDDEGRDREESRRWALTREQRLTYMDDLPEDNEVVAGALWQDPRPEVSVEEEFAGDLGVELGSRLTFDVQGVPLELWVTSLRTVDWGTFGINFFLVVEPGVLEAAPQQRLAAVRLPADREQALQDVLAASYPNVTLLRLREVLAKIVRILERIGLAVALLGGFTVLAGVAILAGAVSATAVRRRREVALLKTLGFTRAGVAGIFAVEYAAVGLVAGAIGAVGGTVLAWAVLTQRMELEWSLDPLPLAVAVLGTAALAVAAGLAASARALTSRPVEVLRSE
ncbi:MAG TPA: FtsX-like permease family protein, partial [Thermoanaerobaculia bacterium]|nr:FtsX-like permease family protein [Thermoanaerobaculia bacterium]